MSKWQALPELLAIVCLTVFLADLANTHAGPRVALPIIMAGAAVIWFRYQRDWDGSFRL